MRGTTTNGSLVCASGSEGRPFGSGFRWSFYGAGDVPVVIRLTMICVFYHIAGTYCLDLGTTRFSGAGYKTRH